MTLRPPKKPQMVIPPDRPPNASPPPSSTSTQLIPTCASKACHQQPPYEILANDNRNIGTNNAIKRIPRQPRQHERRPYLATRNMEPLPPPPRAIGITVSQLQDYLGISPSIPDPKFNYPPSEWKRLPKKR